MPFLHRLANYRPEIAYFLHPGYVLLAGVIAAVPIFYANRLLGFSAAVSVVAAIVALIVVRGLFVAAAPLCESAFPTGARHDSAGDKHRAIRFAGNEAFRTVARDMPQPTAGQFKIVCNELALGSSPSEALENVYLRTQVAEYAIFAVTLAVQLKSGGGLSETLLTLGETVTQRVALAARAKALAGE